MRRLLRKNPALHSGVSTHQGRGTTSTHSQLHFHHNDCHCLWCGRAGTVTRTSEVRPELFMGCFRCLECGTVIRNVEQQFKFTEPAICPTDTCQNKCARAPAKFSSVPLFCRDHASQRSLRLLQQQHQYLSPGGEYAGSLPVGLLCHCAHTYAQLCL